METIDHKIRRLIRYYERMTGSRNPIKIAESPTWKHCWKLQTYKPEALDLH